MLKNPVMFVVWTGTIVTALLTIDPTLFGPVFGKNRLVFNGLVTLILFFTLVFANFAEAVARGRPKAQADAVRSTKADTTARKLLPDGSIQEVSSTSLRRGDQIKAIAGDVIPSDGEVIAGIASVDESAIASESAPVLEEPGSDIASSFTGGTRILSDELTLTIGGLLSAIGIAGMDRVVQFNAIATSGRAVEACGDVNALILDKTGTIAPWNRLAEEFIPVNGRSLEEVASLALAASLFDDTPEGKSIVRLAQNLGAQVDFDRTNATGLDFSAKTRMSGTDLPDGTEVRKGAVDAVKGFVRSRGGNGGPDLDAACERVSRVGATPLGVCQGSDTYGIIYLKDVIKPGIRDRFDQLRKMGIRTIMLTGDNRITASVIADEAGVDDFIAEATPEDKIEVIRKQQAEGKLVAMTGDGTNDAPALAQANVGLAMNSGTQAAKEAANMVDLDSDPTKLIDLVTIGKQLLITRGALTTFSLANDLAKYLAIIPAIFAPVGALNVMGLASGQSAVLSALIYNALIIPALIPLALTGVKFRPCHGGNFRRQVARRQNLCSRKN